MAAAAALASSTRHLILLFPKTIARRCCRAEEREGEGERKGAFFLPVIQEDITRIANESEPRLSRIACYAIVFVYCTYSLPMRVATFFSQLAVLPGEEYLENIFCTSTPFSFFSYTVRGVKKE